ncbi:hypothetical protein NP233_g9967 [Leucocoprinus birnbaumii]|uniref:ABC-2 type transporter transmembrane domain-containing protein n=1 Tax=Leucocoprinus birnbaumii TaxID=56174 RepID=A0AAD5VJX2_9AGAR|nr:hypothetical protein NP233_g9967 [Leucocoprinus birnbaumii]
MDYLLLYCDIEQFLDEADLLANHIAILAAPGKLVASGSPVALKRNLGEGYSIVITFKHAGNGVKADVALRQDLLGRIWDIAPHVVASNISSHQVACSLKSKDDATVKHVLQLLEAEKMTYRIQNYDIIGTSIEDIFLDLMSKNDPTQFEVDSADAEKVVSSDSRSVTAPLVLKNEAPEISVKLASGRCVSPFRQAFTIFHKRLMILMRDPPPGIIRSLGSTANSLRVKDKADPTAFTDYINQNYRNLSLRGVSFNFDSGDTLVAWEGSPPGLMGLSMINLASNVLYKHALTQNAGGTAPNTVILANYSLFPHIAAGTLTSLKWMAFFGAIMSVYPAFFALYVSRERRSSVQAMQLLNGLSDPIGLWLGHLMFDTVFIVILSTVIVIVFTGVSNQFHGLGEVWFIMVLYGITGALFSYCVSLAVTSPLAAFAAVAGYQIIIFVTWEELTSIANTDRRKRITDN